MRITTIRKIFRENGIPDHLTCLLRNFYAGQEATLEPDMEQRTGSKLGKEYVEAVYCHPAYLTYMQSTSYKMLGWMKHKPESRLQGEISITSDMHVTPPLWQKAIRRIKESLDDSERGEWKRWFKTFNLKNSKTKVMASSPITSWQIDGETMETVTDYFLGLQNHCR